MSLSFKKIFWVFVFVSALGIGEVRAQVNTCPPLGSCDSILQQGMRLEAGQGVGVQAPMLVQGNISSQAVCDVFSNTLSSVTGNNYFVPTRTIGEYNSLRAATDGGFVQGVSYVPCGCGDGICMGPPVEDCGPDDSGDPNVRGNPSCASDCGTVCPPICGDGYCPDPQNSPIEHCAAVGNNIIPECNADCGLCTCGGPFFDCTGQCGSCPSCSPCCGDGTINGTEQCDLTDLNGQTCASLGFGSGTLGCTAACLYDTSGCNPLPVCANAFCGDSICNGSEDACICPDDCSATTCGDGCCAGTETCAITAGTNVDNGQCENDCGFCGASLNCTTPQTNGAGASQCTSAGFGVDGAINVAGSCAQSGSCDADCVNGNWVNFTNNCFASGACCTWETTNDFCDPSYPPCTASAGDPDTGGFGVCAVDSSMLSCGLPRICPGDCPDALLCNPSVTSGICGSVANTCDCGTFNDTPDFPGFINWQCVGGGGGSTTNCAVGGFPGGCPYTDVNGTPGVLPDGSKYYNPFGCVEYHCCSGTITNVPVPSPCPPAAGIGIADCSPSNCTSSQTNGSGATQCTSASSASHGATNVPGACAGSGTCDADCNNGSWVNFTNNCVAAPISGCWETVPDTTTINCPADPLCSLPACSPNNILTFPGSNCPTVGNQCQMPFTPGQSLVFDCITTCPPKWTVTNITPVSSCNGSPPTDTCGFTIGAPCSPTGSTSQCYDDVDWAGGACWSADDVGLSCN